MCIVYQLQLPISTIKKDINLCLGQVFLWSPGSNGLYQLEVDSKFKCYVTKKRY